MKSLYAPPSLVRSACSNSLANDGGFDSSHFKRNETSSINRPVGRTNASSSLDDPDSQEVVPQMGTPPGVPGVEKIMGLQRCICVWNKSS